MSGQQPKSVKVRAAQIEQLEQVSLQRLSCNSAEQFGQNAEGFTFAAAALSRVAGSLD